MNIQMSNNENIINKHYIQELIDDFVRHIQIYDTKYCK